jgi:hypothetical protein
MASDGKQGMARRSEPNRAGRPNDDLSLSPQREPAKKRRQLALARSAGLQKDALEDGPCSFLGDAQLLRSFARR